MSQPKVSESQERIGKEDSTPSTGVTPTSDQPSDQATLVVDSPTDLAPANGTPGSSQNGPGENGRNGHNGYGESENPNGQKTLSGQDDFSMDEESFAAMLDQYDTVLPNRGDLITGQILRIENDAIFVDVGAKRDAIIPGSDLGRLDNAMVKGLSAGDELPLYVMSTPWDDEELFVSLSKGLAEQEWTRAEQIMENDEAVDLEVIGFNAGGMLLGFAHLRGFVPNSHVPGLRYLNTNEERDAFKQQQIGQTNTVKVIEVNRERRRLVLSVKAARKEAKARRMAELEEGSVVTGIIVNLEDYGAFVDLGGVTGLAHISTLDHARLRHPSQVMSVGDEVEFLVEEVDQERNRIRLNRQALLPNPWEMLIKEHKVGDSLTGKVSNVVDFGAFVRLPAGVEGLVHVSEMPLAPGMAPRDLVKTGEEVTVRILRIEAKRERVGLTMLPEEPDILWTVADESGQGAGENDPAQLDQVQLGQDSEDEEPDMVAA